MMENRSLLRLSTALFMVQASAWCIFSFLCILCIENVIKQLNGTDDYDQLLLSTIYAIFFTKDLDHSDTRMVVKPVVFEAFAFIHLFVSISWLFTSARVYYQISNRNIENLPNSNLLKSWLINGYIIAVIDFIFTILLMVDLIETNRVYRVFTINFDRTLTMPAIGLVFTIVSRGFVLWIVNVTLLVTFTRSMWMNARLFKHDDFETRYGNQYDGNAYVNSGYAPTTPSQVMQHGYPTASYPQQQYGNARMLPAANQDYDPYGQQNTRQPVTSPGYPAATQVSPYAQINRNPSPGRQSPPTLHAVSPPQIPDPDYQLGPRTVLKNRSQYDDRY